MNFFRKEIDMQTERQFLEQYDASAYPRPSVTSDILIFTTIKNNLAVLLIRRGGHPFKDKLAIPGGFLMAGKESPEEAAMRELHEETGIRGIFMQQLATFGDPERDPRTHVISVVFMCHVPYSKLKWDMCHGAKAGDDAAEMELFQIRKTSGEWCLMNEYGTKFITRFGDLAFDHGKIIETGIRRMQGRLEYTNDFFEFIDDSQNFTMKTLQNVHEAILMKELDSSNFRKSIQRRFIKTGIMQKTEHTGKEQTYEIIPQEVKTT